jgi:hypothetical protein
MPLTFCRLTAPRPFTPSAACCDALRSTAPDRGESAVSRVGRTRPDGLAPWDRQAVIVKTRTPDPHGATARSRSGSCLSCLFRRQCCDQGRLRRPDRIAAWAGPGGQDGACDEPGAAAFGTTVVGAACDRDGCGSKPRPEPACRLLLPSFRPGRCTAMAGMWTVVRSALICTRLRGGRFFHERREGRSPRTRISSSPGRPRDRLWQMMRPPRTYGQPRPWSPAPSRCPPSMTGRAALPAASLVTSGSLALTAPSRGRQRPPVRACPARFHPSPGSGDMGLHRVRSNRPGAQGIRVHSTDSSGDLLHLRTAGQPGPWRYL